MEWQKRLKLAVNNAGETPSTLQAKLAEFGVKGSSYGAVWSYLNKEDVPTPPTEFFEAAGKILGVRPAWLAFGEEPETEAELGAAQQASEQSTRLADALQELYGSPISDEVKHLFSSVVERVLVEERRMRERLGGPPTTAAAVAERIARITLSVLHDRGMAEGGWTLRLEEINAHLVAMLLAIRLAYPLDDKPRGYASLTVESAEASAKGRQRSAKSLGRRKKT